MARHDLWSDEQRDAARRILSRVEDEQIRTVRVCWADVHGVSRAKFLRAGAFRSALDDGMDFQGASLIMDTGNHVFTPLFVAGGGFGIAEFTGFPDVVLVPDPSTFRVLPGPAKEGWILCDMYFRNGKPVPFSTRGILGRQIAEAARHGYELVTGLEIEFYVTRRHTLDIAVDETGQPPPPPAVSPAAQGYQYLSESRLAELGPALDSLTCQLEELGLPVRTIEGEWGPGQCELTFDPTPAMAAADALLLFRSVAKQFFHARGLHVTFMSRPALPNYFSSGWHLHQSLVSPDTGANAFVAGDGDTILSDVGRHYVGGLIDRAVPMSVFTNPTITGYKRLKPYSFAPDRANWARENRGAMIRIQGEPGEPNTHVENRAGEPMANPYLYVAANLAAGIDGIARRVEPPAIVDSDPYASDSVMLPKTLWDAVAALEEDGFFRSAFGDSFIDYLLMAKRSEIDRFLGEVTDWEQREYFDLF